MQFAQRHAISDVCILCTDIERSIRFYVDKLGFQLKHRAESFADFTGAGLRNASFCGANVSHAKFTGADLSGADFTGANCMGVNFSDANLGNARGISHLLH